MLAGRAGLADRAQRPAGRAALVVAGRRAAGHPGLRALLCLDQRRARHARALCAGVLVSVLAYFPFLYLPVSAQLRRLDPALEDAAASLGLAPWRVFLRVVLPQLRLAICGGSLLIGLHLLAEYGLYAMIRFDTFTTAIVDQFQSTYNGPAANMLAGVLVLCCLGLLALEVAGARRASAMPASAPARRAAPARAPRPAAVCSGPAAAADTRGCSPWRAPRHACARWLCSAAPASLAARRTSRGASAQTLVFARRRRCWSRSLAALPMAWLSVRAPGRLQRRAGRPATTMSARCRASSSRWRSSRSPCAVAAALPDASRPCCSPTR